MLRSHSLFLITRSKHITEPSLSRPASLRHCTSSSYPLLGAAQQERTTSKMPFVPTPIDLHRAQAMSRSGGTPAYASDVLHYALGRGFRLSRVLCLIFVSSSQRHYQSPCQRATLLPHPSSRPKRSERCCLSPLFATLRFVSLFANDLPASRFIQ